MGKSAPRASTGRGAVIKRMYESGEWSDLAIQTQTKTFKVHKSVVCPACPFFNAACTNGFLETETGVIVLEESEVIVDAILKSIYELPITWLQYRKSELREWQRENKRVISPNVEHASMEIADGKRPADRFCLRLPELRARAVHAHQLYIALDKYNIRSLEAIAVLSFSTHFLALLEMPLWMVETALVVWNDDAHNDMLKEIIVDDCGKNLAAIMACPKAWECMHKDQSFTKGVILKSLGKNGDEHMDLGEDEGGE